MRGHRNRHGREQRGEQRDEREEVTRAVERLAHLRLAVLQRFERDAAHLAAVHPARARTARNAPPTRPRPRPASRYVTRLPKVMRPVDCDFVGAQHQARREVDERETAVEFARDHRADREVATADFHGIADMHLQRVEQRLIDPHGARRRNRLRGMVRRARRRRDAQRAAQRITGRHRLDRGEPRDRLRAGRIDHAGKDRRAGGIQTERFGLPRRIADRPDDRRAR